MSLKFFFFFVDSQFGMTLNSVMNEVAEEEGNLRVASYAHRIKNSSIGHMT